MATIIDAGMGIYEGLCADDQDAYVNDMVDEARFRDAREDVIYKFYETGLSFKAAESMAILWAKAFGESEWDDKDVVKVAQALELDWDEYHLIMNHREAYFESKKFTSQWR